MSVLYELFLGCSIINKRHSFTPRPQSSVENPDLFLGTVHYCTTVPRPASLFATSSRLRLHRMSKKCIHPQRGMYQMSVVKGIPFGYPSVHGPERREKMSSSTQPRAAERIRCPKRATNELTSPSTPCPAVSSPPSPVTTLRPPVLAAAAADEALVLMALVTLREAVAEEIVELSEAVAFSDTVEETRVVEDDEEDEEEDEAEVVVEEVQETVVVVEDEEGSCVGSGVGSGSFLVVVGSASVLPPPPSHSHEMETTPIASSAKRRKSWSQLLQWSITSERMCVGGISTPVPCASTRTPSRPACDSTLTPSPARTHPRRQVKVAVSAGRALVNDLNATARQPSSHDQTHPTVTPLEEIVSVLKQLGPGYPPPYWAESVYQHPSHPQRRLTEGDDIGFVVAVHA